MLEDGKIRISDLQRGGLIELLTKCNFADFEVDHNNKASILNLFQGKKIGKMSMYIKELIQLDNNMRHDKKLMKKLFEEKASYNQFMAINLEWILEKTTYDFSKDELHGLLMYLQKNAQFIVQGNKDYPSKFDTLIKKFIADQGCRP